MIKLGGIICDRCRTLTASIPFAHCFTTKAEKRNMHFCSERCQIVFYKGQKYWRRKLEILKSKGVIT